MNIVNNLCGGLDLVENPYLSLDDIDDTQSKSNDGDGKPQSDDTVGAPLFLLDQAPDRSEVTEIITISNNATENRNSGTMVTMTTIKNARC